MLVQASSLLYNFLIRRVHRRHKFPRRRNNQLCLTPLPHLSRLPRSCCPNRHRTPAAPAPAAAPGDKNVVVKICLCFLKICHLLLLKASQNDFKKKVVLFQLK